jgi:hypothetical protein
VRGRLVGDEIERLSTSRQLRHDLGGVAEQADRERTALARRGPHTLQRLFQRFGSLVQVTRFEPPPDPLGVDLDAQDRRTRERGGQRLRAAHSAETRGQDRPPREVGGAEVLLTGSHERLVGALQDALAADVDPASRSHLAEHRQAESLEPAELVPGGPARDEQRVRDQDARSSGARPEDSDRLAALNEQRLVVAERQQRADERAQRLGIPRRLSRAAVDDELLGPLGDLRVEIVQQHSQRAPPSTTSARSARCREAHGSPRGRRRAPRPSRRPTGWYSKLLLRLPLPCPQAPPGVGPSPARTRRCRR